jgi:enoyl-CoA hydratase/carnithine racemase
MLKEADAEFKYYFCLHANETLLRLEQTPKLVIAALNGHTVGGGLEVALAADIRIAKRDAGKIGLPEVALGVLPGTGGTQRLARLVGKARAIEMMATGRLMSFDEAKALGLVQHVWGGDDLQGASFMDAVLEYARQFTPPNKASRAVGGMKRAVQSGVEAGFLEGLSLERELQQLLFQSEDAKEGLAASLAKRKPEFKGK